MIKLMLDTSDNKEIMVGLEINGKEYLKTKKITYNKTQIVLPMIDSILKERKIKLGEIQEIEVNTIPGSFTGIRVGLAIANAFSFALKIPVKIIK